jgi:hypothetical protein
METGCNGSRKSSTSVKKGSATQGARPKRLEQRTIRKEVEDFGWSRKGIELNWIGLGKDVCLDYRKVFG